MQRLIMEAVFSKFQAEAIAEMILNQISYEGEDTPDKQIDQTKETVEDMVDTLKEFYNNEEGENGGTEDLLEAFREDISRANSYYPDIILTEEE